MKNVALVLFCGVVVLGVPVVAQGSGGGSGGHGGGSGGDAGGIGCGDVFGDLIHVLRDVETGQPILAKRWIELPRETQGYGWGYCPIAVDPYGDEIPFLPYTCDPADPTAVVAVDYFGRLNGGRTKEKNSRMHFNEVISTIKEAGYIKQDPAGRLLLGFDCAVNGGGQIKCAEWAAIDSPMESLGLYTRLMKYGHLQTDPNEVDIWSHGDPAQGAQYNPALGPEDWPKFHSSVRHLLPAGGNVGSCFLAGGTFVTTCAQPESLDHRDFVRAASFLAGAANKTGDITVDLVQYMNRILKIAQDTEATAATPDTLPALVRDCWDSIEDPPSPSEDDPVLEDPPYLPVEECTLTEADSTVPNWDLFADVREQFVDFSATEYERPDWRNEQLLIIVPISATGFEIQDGVPLLGYLDFRNPLLGFGVDIDGFVKAASDGVRTIELIHNYEVPVDLGYFPY